MRARHRKNGTQLHLVHREWLFDVDAGAGRHHMVCHLCVRLRRRRDVNNVWTGLGEHHVKVGVEAANTEPMRRLHGKLDVPITGCNNADPGQLA
jgi:hypothetical protein